MTTSNKFSGSNYDIERTEEGQFVLVDSTGPDQTYDLFEDLVEDNPTCEEARAWAEGTD